MTLPTIDMARLRENILALGQVGRAGATGLNRRAFSDEDRLGREWLKKRLTMDGFTVHQDGAANISTRLASQSDLPVVMIGSHLDTVPGGGSLDGALGVLVGLEVLRAIKKAQIPLDHPLELINFSDEEGRFGGMLGSQAIAGLLTKEKIEEARDLQGVTLTAAMAEWQLDANEALLAKRDPETIHAFLELHIEQGPILDRHKLSIGVVEAITGLFKWEVCLRGEANHAGTTPMNMRLDAFQGLAEFASQIDPLLEQYGSTNSRATIGRVELTPGAANTVPEQAIFSIEARDTDATILNRLATIFRQTLAAIAQRRGLGFDYVVLSEITPTRCDRTLVDLISHEATAMKQPFLPMVSGAAHDTQSMSAISPTAMIFVPSVQGRSHSDDEWTDWDDIEIGAKLLLRTVVKLAAFNYSDQL